jgi:hypothetical protein
MKQRLHWALTITALVVAVFGVTPLGSATVKTGLAAAKEPLRATGILTTGPRGPRGPRGPKGDRGRQGLRGKGVVARARAKTTVTTPGADRLTGNTWVQGAAEDDLILGSITYQSPSVCTMQTQGDPELSVIVYLDGTPVGGFTLFDLQASGATTLFPSALYVFASGADRSHTLTARVSSTCQEPFRVTALKLDVTALA